MAVGKSLVFSLGCTGFSTRPFRIESSSCSRGQATRFRGCGASFRSEAFRNGGRDRINSRITACASFFTFGGMSPSTITLRRLYFRDRMSSIRISYGVSSYSIGVREKLIFFSLTPRRSSSTTCIQKRAQSLKWIFSSTLPEVSAWALSRSTSASPWHTRCRNVLNSRVSVANARHTAR